MNSAKLDRKIMIQKRAEDIDEIGNHTFTWHDYYLCHATLSGMGGLQADRTAQQIEFKTMDFTIRSCEKIKPLNAIDYRLIYNGEPYNIIQVEESSYHKQYVKLHAERAYDGEKN